MIAGLQQPLCRHVSKSKQTIKERYCVFLSDNYKGCVVSLTWWHFCFMWYRYSMGVGLSMGVCFVCILCHDVCVCQPAEGCWAPHSAWRPQTHQYCWGWWLYCWTRARVIEGTLSCHSCFWIVWQYYLLQSKKIYILFIFGAMSSTSKQNSKAYFLSDILVTGIDSWWHHWNQLLIKLLWE